MKFAARSGSLSSIAMALVLACCLPGSAAWAQAAPVPESEQPEVRTISAPQPSWVYVRGGFGSGGTQIFDTATGKMIGSVATSRDSDMAIDPAGRLYYVSETIWAKGNRGIRQDMVSIYDSAALKLQTEIAIPGRLIIGGRRNNFVLSDDGKTAFVYDFSPTSSVNVVDLGKRKFARNIELPGCASLMPNPGVGFSALCSDGSMATVAVGGAKPAITRSAPFFEASEDPIFDNFDYDAGRRQTVMVSYTGKVYVAAMGTAPTVSEPFSMQAAAGLRPGDTKPLDINWYPGGTQVMALHRPTGHLYVLMHPGEYWSHKEGGTEVWVVDPATRKVVKRHPLPEKAENIQVTQEAAPKVVVNTDGGTLFVYDAATWEQKHAIKDACSGLIAVANPS